MVISENLFFFYRVTNATGQTGGVRLGWPYANAIVRMQSEA